VVTDPEGNQSLYVDNNDLNLTESYQAAIKDPKGKTARHLFTWPSMNASWPGTLDIPLTKLHSLFFDAAHYPDENNGKGALGFHPKYAYRNKADELKETGLHELGHVIDRRTGEKNVATTGEYRDEADRVYGKGGRDRYGGEHGESRRNYEDLLYSQEHGEALKRAYEKMYREKRPTGTNPYDHVDTDYIRMPGRLDKVIPTPGRGERRMHEDEMYRMMQAAKRNNPK
jgi:hypothetical protein